MNLSIDHNFKSAVMLYSIIGVYVYWAGQITQKEIRRRENGHKLVSWQIIDLGFYFYTLKLHVFNVPVYPMVACWACNSSHKNTIPTPVKHSNWYNVIVIFV